MVNLSDARRPLLWAAALFGVFLVTCTEATRCPSVTVVTDFQVKRYLGRWIELKRIPKEFQSGGTCVTADYFDGPNNTVIVFNRNYQPSLGRYTSITGSARFAGAPSTAKLLVSFPRSIGEGDYWVLGTDYDNYAVVWSCRERDEASPPDVTAWVLSRGGRLSEESWRTVNSILAGTGADLSALEDTKRQCPDTDCSRQWPIVQNPLSPKRMSGRWLELRHSSANPGSFQNVSCGAYRINPTNQGLHFAYSAFNNSAGNDIHIDYEGIWRNVTSKQGVFRLQGAAEDSELWVLYTDYDRIALIAICEARGPDLPTKGGVQLLSRSPELNIVDEFAINGALLGAGLNAPSLVDVLATPCPLNVALSEQPGRLPLAIPLIITALFTFH